MSFVKYSFCLITDDKNNCSTTGFSCFLIALKLGSNQGGEIARDFVTSKKRSGEIGQREEAQGQTVFAFDLLKLNP